MTRNATKHKRRDLRRLHLILGALAIAVVAIGGEISFHALSGLPFQTHYDVSVTLPGADRLIPTDDVRVAGVRVGQVAAVAAVPGHAGEPPHAVVRLQLSPSLGRLPTDTSVQVRPASVLGATYVALTLGHARQTIPPGAVLPLDRARSTVDVTDLLQLFKGSAAKNFQNSTADFAAGLSGEGSAFNATVGSLAALMGPLTVVSGALASPDAHLTRFIVASDRAFGALSPVGAQLSALLRGAATTFAALAAQPSDVAASIDDAPASETSGTVALQRALPGFRGLSRLMQAVAPAIPLLAPGLATLNETFAAGTLPLERTPIFARSLRGALLALERISRVPSTGGALRKLAQLVVAFRAAIDPLEQAQLHCNVVPLSFLGQSGFLGSLGTGQGPSLTNITVDNRGNSTDGQQAAAPPSDAHVDYRPIDNASECAAGNEPDLPGTRNLSSPTGLSDHTHSSSPPPGVLALAAKAGLLAEAPR